MSMTTWNPSDPGWVTTAIEKAQAALGSGSATAAAPAATPPASAGPAGTADQRDAFARVQELLTQYGLQTLAGFVWNAIVGGKSNDEVLQDLRQTPEFQQRFKAIIEREKAGLPAISPAEVVAYERQAAELYHQAGLPAGFYDTPDDFADLIGKDVSISELGDRVNNGIVAARQAPQDMRDALQRLYGVSDGGITALFLDPDKAEPLLMQQFRASDVAGSAVRAGYGLLDQTQAEQLAALGLTGRTAQQGFGDLQAQHELFHSLPGENADSISTQDQLAAQFGGNANARQRIQQRAAQRAAVFQAGGGFGTDKEGIGGLGPAQT